MCRRRERAALDSPILKVLEGPGSASESQSKVTGQDLASERDGRSASALLRDVGINVRSRDDLICHGNVEVLWDARDWCAWLTEDARVERLLDDGCIEHLLLRKVEELEDVLEGQAVGV